MMNFRLRLDEALLRSREPAANALDRIERERGQGVLIQGVEVRPMVRGADLHEHPNDDPEKPRQLRHSDTLHRRSEYRLSVWFRQANVSALCCERFVQNAARGRSAGAASEITRAREHQRPLGGAQGTCHLLKQYSMAAQNAVSLG